MSKICSYCHNNKTYEDFHKHKGKKDGYNDLCKDCVKIKKQKRIEKNLLIILPDDYHKNCYKCKKNLHKNEFYNQNDSSDGLNTVCIDCSKKKTKKWRSSNKDKVKSYRDN